MFLYLRYTCAKLIQALLASMLALGARRSSHSAILGSSSSPSLEEERGYGFKRESSCRLLTQRAVDIVENSKLLENYSAEALEVVVVLRVALFGPCFLSPFSCTRLHLKCILFKSCFPSALH